MGFLFVWTIYLFIFLIQDLQSSGLGQDTASPAPTSQESGLQCERPHVAVGVLFLSGHHIASCLTQPLFFTVNFLTL